MKYVKILSNGIKRLRDERDLTQEQFASIIGMSVQGVRNLEQCKYQPTADTIDAICSAFDITPFELLIPPTPEDEQKLILSIIQRLKLFNKDKLKFISGVIDLMK